MTAADAKALDAGLRVVDVCQILIDLLPASAEDLASDIRSRWAVERGLIRIGEAVLQIPEDVRSRFPEQPWRQIIGMRNFAAHQYDELDPRRVWRTVAKDVPALRDYLAVTVLPELRRI